MKLLKQSQWDVWKKFDTRLGEVELCLRRPNYAELLSDAASVGADAWENRISYALRDWRGVNGDDDAPLPFTVERFHALCEACPNLFQNVLTEIGRLYMGLGEDARGNSETLPASGSADGVNSGAESATGSL